MTSRGREGESSPRGLWGSSSLSGGSRFSLFGSPPSPAPAATHTPSSAHTPAGVEPSAQFVTSPAPTSERAGGAAEPAADDHTAEEDNEQPRMMMAQLDAMFGSDALFGAEPTADGLGAPSAHQKARSEYIALHSLDKIFADAVDRAMRHQVASPVQFIAHELLRSSEGSA